MKSFEPGVLERQVFPGSLATVLRLLGEYRVRLAADRLPPRAHERLRRTALTADVDCADRLDPFAAGDFTPQDVLRLHAQLRRFTPEGGGSWKISDDLVTETLPDGSTTVVFTPVPAYAVEDAMNRLHESFNRRWREGEIDPLLLIPAYLLDFQCIHPFAEGTDTVARLVGRLLLQRAGYPLGPLVPFDALFEQSTAARSAALQASWRGWHGATHNLAAWTAYLLGIVLDACRHLEQDLATAAPPRGAKRDSVAAAIDRLPAEFRYVDLEQLVPAVSRPTINRALRRLRQQRVVRCIRPGRNARWARIPQIRGDGRDPQIHAEITDPQIHADLRRFTD